MKYLEWILKYPVKGYYFDLSFELVLFIKRIFFFWKFMRLILFLSSLLFVISIHAAPAVFNQVGFHPKSTKQIVVRTESVDTVHIINIVQGKTVMQLVPPFSKKWDYSEESVQLIDISSIKTPGTYLAIQNGVAISNNIVIDKDVYVDLGKSLLKWFYYQRSSTALEAKYAGKWARLAGHPDTSVLIYGTDKKISSPKGWYDAGDYGKYIVNSGITVFTLLNLYEHFPKLCDTLQLHIPESKRGKSDLLSEVRWNLDWMLSMQDADGGVYHKLTTKKFSGSVMPHQDKAERVVLPKSTAASLNFSGVMAQASRVYKKTDPSFSKKTLVAAEKAYLWAKEHPNVVYEQPQDVNTGTYTPKGENNLDEFRFAAAELYESTKKTIYLKDLNENLFNANGPWWGDLNFLSVYRVASSKAFKELQKTAQDTLLTVANRILEVAKNSAYGPPIEEWNWVWGSNSAVANNGIILLYAYYITQNKDFLGAAQSALDYVLGRNPLNFSYVSGFGYKSPKNPHHRPSEADEIDDPVPGMVVGGAHSGKQDVGEEPWQCKDYTAEKIHALNYTDDRCSYATNEVAINWNSPVAYLTIALQAIYNGYVYKFK